MKKNNFSGTGKKDIKFTACKELVSVSKVCSFSKMMKNKLLSKRMELAFSDNKSLKIETDQKESHDNAACKTSAFFLPTRIRIRATDREGNTIEITY